MKITLKNLPSFLFLLKPGDRIFLKWPLWSWKTTFSQALIRNFLKDQSLSITSPTYTYYTQYPNDLYHFDLYRITHKNDIMRIWAEEIFDDPQSICIIEWPEIVEDIIEPTRIIELYDNEQWKEISITNCQAVDIDNRDEFHSI